MLCTLRVAWLNLHRYPSTYPLACRGAEHGEGAAKRPCFLMARGTRASVTRDGQSADLGGGAFLDGADGLKQEDVRGGQKLAGLCR